MNRHIHHIRSLALICILSILGLWAFVGCETFDSFKEEYPVASNLAKGGLFIGLNALAAQNEIIYANRDALAAAINTAFAQSRSPEDAAAILDAQTLEILQDNDVRASLLAAWQAQLRDLAATPEGSPAAGPEHAYCRDLAAAIGQ